MFLGSASNPLACSSPPPIPHALRVGSLPTAWAAGHRARYVGRSPNPAQAPRKRESTVRSSNWAFGSGSREGFAPDPKSTQRPDGEGGSEFVTLWDAMACGNRPHGRGLDLNPNPLALKKLRRAAKPPLPPVRRCLTPDRVKRLRKTALSTTGHPPVKSNRLPDKIPPQHGPNGRATNSRRTWLPWYTPGHILRGP